MKKGIIVSSVVLSNAFKEASKVKPYKGLPCTESFLLECSPDRTYLVRSNIEDTVKVELGCECNFTGAFLLEASIGKLMAKIEDQPISINIMDDDVKTVYVYGDGFQTKIGTDHPDDYITHVKKEYKEVGSMDYNELRSMLERLVPFLSTDELRPTMTGFCFDESNVTATNGHVLRTIPYCGFNIEASKSQLKEVHGKVIPGRNEFIVSNMFKYLPKNLKDDITFSLSAERSHVKVEFYNHVIYAKLIDDRYPDYKAVWITDFVTEFSLKSLDLKKTIEQAMIFTNKSTNQININVGDEVEIHSEDLDFATEFNKTLEDVDISGMPMKFAVSGRWLLECLKHFDGEVRFQLAAPNKGIILNDEILLMPMMIAG